MPSGGRGATTDVLSALRHHRDERPDTVAMTWLSQLSIPSDQRTYAELDASAAAIAGAIRQRVPAGSRVMLMMRPGLGFVEAFFGSMYAGCIPVPVAENLERPGQVDVLRRIVGDSGTELVWTSNDADAAVARRALGVEAEWRPVADAAAEELRPDLDRPAFLQYTSGSTGRPKGVVVTHGNLAANLASIAVTFRHDRSSAILSWLPMFHDMGLIGNVLHPLHLGCPTYLAAPADFARNPLAWLRAIHQFAITTSGAPTFGYELVVRALRAGKVFDGDLSGWRSAYCGAEPVSAAVLGEFAERLTPSGFDRRSLMPCYGLAEATLLVSSSEPGDLIREVVSADGTRVVSCGTPRDCRVEITDEAGQSVPDGKVGEVRVTGPSVAEGYWGHDRHRDEVFGGDSGTRWVRTGDLGFMIDGEVFLSGRRSDVIIIRGRNFHAHDIESAARRAAPGIRACVAVADEAKPGVVILADAAAGSWTEAVRTGVVVAVADEFGIAVTQVIRLGPGRLPRTTSGKLRRSEARRRWLDGEYGPAGSIGTPSAVATATGPAAGRLRDVIGRTLGFVPADDQPLTAAGLDSLGALRLSAELHDEFGLSIPVRLLLAGATPAVVADLLDTGACESPPPATVDGQLSKAQESLAFLQMLDSEGDEYCITVAWELENGTDIAMFESALRMVLSLQPGLNISLVAGAAGLRSTEISAEAFQGALQFIVAEVAAPDLTRQLSAAAATTFDLAAGPLFRLHRWLVDGRRVYQLVVHHVVTDMWTLCRMIDDVGAAYTELRAGRVPEKRQPQPYDVYVAEQQHYLQSPAAAERDGRLRERLPRRPGPLALRTDRQRGIRRDARSARVTAMISAPLDQGHNLVAELTGVWAACLHRYGTPNPVVLGVPVTGRPSGRLADVAGPCTNTVPLAVEVKADQPLAEFFAEIREQLLEGIDNGLYPFSRAVEVVRPIRQAGRSPLAETAITVLESPLPRVPGLVDALAGETAELTFGDLRVRTVPVPRHSCRYDLDMVVAPCDGGLRLYLDYAVALFAPETAQAIVDTFAHMAAAVPDAHRVSDVFVLTPEDREIVSSQARSAEPESSLRLVDRIRAVAISDPDAIALSGSGLSVSFGRFAERMDRIGGALTRHSATAVPHCGAAILISDAGEFAQAMFGAWSAGLGVVPLPCDFPDARLRHMLEQAAPQQLLTDAAGQSRAVSLASGLDPAIDVLVVKDLMDVAAAAPPAASAVSAPAFTVFTSGSTGGPKGVVIRQDQLSRLLAWELAAWQLGPWVRMAQTLSLGFDFGLQEMCTALVAGGCLLVPTAADRSGAHAYVRFLRRERITALFTTPSFADQLISVGEPLTDLRLVLLGGEVLRGSTAAMLRVLAGPGCRIVNGYGPTEATINCLAYDIPPTFVGEVPAIMPVGRPSGASTIELVDASDRPLPVGAVGEILIGGPGVADGYLHEPELTAQRFVTRSVAGQPDAVVYRSGDLAYLDRSEGYVVTGRLDRQRKVRGFRVELAEVEGALRTLPGVSAATALIVDGPCRLVAAVAGVGIDVSTMRRELAERLPAAMIPEQFVLVEQLPANHNGKVHESGLEELAQAQYQVLLPGLATAHEVEAAVCKAWATVLPDAAVGPETNVFDLGAHSLVVSQVHVLLQTAIGATFPVHYLFEYPEPGRLAIQLAAHRPGIGPVTRMPTLNAEDQTWP